VRPLSLEVKFKDGSTKRVSARAIKAVLAEGQEPVEAAGLVAAASDQELAATWKLDTVEDVEHVLGLLLPGTWHRTLLTKLQRATPGQPGFYMTDGKVEHLPVTPAEVDALTRVLDLSMVSQITDPWAISGEVADLLQAAGHVVYANSVDKTHTRVDGHEDATQPALYQRLAAQGQLDGVITAPPLRLLDLAVPLACRYMRSMGCFYVPGGFVTDAPEPRQQWLQQLQAEGRLCVVCGLPKGSAGQRGVWMCVFASRLVRSRMVRGGVYLDNVFTLG
jgi:hypothetical protein